MSLMFHTLFSELAFWASCRSRLRPSHKAITMLAAMPLRCIHLFTTFSFGPVVIVSIIRSGNPDEGQIVFSCRIYVSIDNLSFMISLIAHLIRHRFDVFPTVVSFFFADLFLPFAATAPQLLLKCS